MNKTTHRVVKKKTVELLKNVKTKGKKRRFFELTEKINKNQNQKFRDLCSVQGETWFTHF